jgi:hypothetical protein
MQGVHGCGEAPGEKLSKLLFGVDVFALDCAEGDMLADTMVLVGGALRPSR